MQCVIDASNAHKSQIDEFSRIKLESVVTITGKILARTAETINKNLATGEIEIAIDNLIIESMAAQIPFQINDENSNYPEDLRLKYRFLDLRRTEMQKKLKITF